MSTGKRVCLKGKYLITTEGVHNDLKACEIATRERRVSGGGGGARALQLLWEISRSIGKGMRKGIPM